LLLAARVFPRCHAAVAIRGFSRQFLLLAADICK